MVAFAILLPTVDPVSLLFETIPLLILFEASIWLSRIMEKRWFPTEAEPHVSDDDQPYAVPLDETEEWEPTDDLDHEFPIDEPDLGEADLDQTALDETAAQPDDPEGPADPTS